MSRILEATCLALVVTFSMLADVSSARADGKLDRARKEMRDGDGSGGTNHGEDDDDSGDGWLDALFCFMTFDCGTSGSHEVGMKLDTAYGYARHPYAGTAEGYLVPREILIAQTDDGVESDVAPPLTTRPRAWSGDLAPDAGYLDDLTRLGLRTRFRMPFRFELDARLTGYRESLAEADRLDDGSRVDTALVGAEHVSVRMLEAPRFALRAGLGMVHWSDVDGTLIGPEVTLGFDWFVGRPWVLSADVGGGRLQDAPTFTGRVHVGLAIDRIEPYVAFEYLRIGDAELATPTIGARLWL